jgi:thiol-disulfide isomerase/thioredoxin
MKKMYILKAATKHRMMPNITLLLCFVFIWTAVLAQDKGIRFEHHLSWSAIAAKAKAEKKYIFVDCYTTWCGPCKYMTKNIFPLQEVGDFFNQAFINVKYQMDSTAKDDEEVKRKHADAAFINKEYSIMFYPTYLFFNPDGELVRRDGGSSEAAEFIALGKNALNPAKQYYMLAKQYEQGDHDPGLLKQLALMAGEISDEKFNTKYTNAYFATQKDLLSEDNLQVVYDATKSASDTGFKLIMNNLAVFEKIRSREQIVKNMKGIILSHEYSAKENRGLLNWNESGWIAFKNRLKEKYPPFYQDMFIDIKARVAAGKKQWTAYAKLVTEYAQSGNAYQEELNNYAWAVFRECNDKIILNQALRWSLQSFTNVEKPEPGYMDTYANILYKLGRKKEALHWEKKAQETAIAQGTGKDWGQDVIDKINKGQKTW